jgi:hypothetical protein
MTVNDLISVIADPGAVTAGRRQVFGLNFINPPHISRTAGLS